MVIMCNEELATRIAEKWKRTALYSLSKSTLGVDLDGVVVPYAKLSFMPSDDEINAIISGDMKLKKLIKKVKKAVTHPSVDSADIGLGLSQVMSMVSSKGEDGYPICTVFILDSDPKNEARTKILKKFIKGLFKIFDMKVLTNKKKIKKIFKGKKKKVRNNMIELLEDNSRYEIGNEGIGYLRNLIKFYELELRMASIIDLPIDSGMVKKSQIRAIRKSMVEVFTAKNLRALEEDRSEDDLTKQDLKNAKRLSKKDKKCVKAYVRMRKALKQAGVVNLPKVEYGYKRDKENYPVKPKMDTKEFKKFFKKEKNFFWAMLALFNCVNVVTFGYDIGTKEYLSTCKRTFKAFDEEKWAAASAALSDYASSISK